VPTRGARPELTVTKHQLRDWIESRLATLGQQFDDKAPAIQINRTLKTVEMPPLPDAPGEFNLIGTVRDVDLHFDSGAFVVVTGVGILCGYDESVYAYEWRNGRWERLWESEQNDDTPEKTYKPRSIDSVYVWAGSIDSGHLVREVVRNYSIRGDHIQRVDPVALSPRDFVDEWLVRPWTGSAAWSGAAGLEEWHKKMHADWVAGDFDYPASMHCQTPDLWQVGFTPADEKKNFEPKPEVYFLVRWRPPYHFTMVGAADKPRADSNQPDPEADEWRTLFSSQEWRQ